MEDFVVAPLSTKEISTTEYSAFICALGYESRARAILERFEPRAQHRVALEFPEPQTGLAFRKNRAAMSDFGCDIRPAQNDARFRAAIQDVFSTLRTESGVPLRVLIDVSSQTRSRIAQLLMHCKRLGRTESFQADIVYALADFSPSDRNELPMQYIEPVCPEFAGVSLDPGRPPTAVVGLGYEVGKALGAVEYLQADESWMFVPESPIGEYLIEVAQANELLLASTPPRRVIRYEVLNPFDTYGILESLVFGLERDSRPMLLPFGPKIFSVVSMLAALKHETASVWRISSGEPERPTDRIASRHVCGLQIRFPGGDCMSA